MKSKNAKECYDSIKNISPFKTNSEIEAVAKKLPDFIKTTRAVICICVVAFGGQEELVIQNLIFELEKIKGKWDEYQIIVFANWPEGKTPDRVPGYLKEAASGIVGNLQVVSHEVLGPKNIGYIRGLLHGAVTLKSEQAGIDPIQITMDADTVKIHPDIISGYLEKFSIKETMAVVGQLDWESLLFNVNDFPGFMTGNHLMRLLPKYGNKQPIEDKKLPLYIKEELIFSNRSFGRGVQSNFAFKTSAYKLAGGYSGKLEHDEFDNILRRIWISQKNIGNTNSIRFGWKEDGIWVASEARRALFAYSVHNLPPMRQWDSLRFWTSTEDDVRIKRPKLEKEGFDHKIILDQINKTLECYNLPMDMLSKVVPQALQDLGLNHKDYAIGFMPYTEDSFLYKAIITEVHNWKNFKV